MLDGQRVSSTRIRAALQAGDFDAATRLLGASYSIGGRVVSGRQLGRTLGYPTATLRFDEKRPALSGIYATLVHRVGDRPWTSRSHFGPRPPAAALGTPIEAPHF